MGGLAVGGDVDHHLQLGMVEQPAVARAIVALREIGLETLDIEAADPGLALVDPAQKPHFAFIGEEVDNLIIL